MYLNTTKNLNFIISSQINPVLTSYSDADWTGDKATRKSTSGIIFLSEDNPLSWFLKRQNCIALSSSESEYIAHANAAQEILWLLILLEDLFFKQSLHISYKKTTCLVQYQHKLRNIVLELSTQMLNIIVLDIYNNKIQYLLIIEGQKKWLQIY